MAGYCRLPHPRAGRACRVLRSLRRAALPVPLMELLAIPLGYQKTVAKWLVILPQPALPAVPDARQGSLARGAAAGVVAGTVLPSGVHLASRP